MNFLNIYKHLLPNAKSWRLSANKKLTALFDGLTGIISDTKLFADLVWLDIFPQTTREIDLWEDQWALPAGDLTEQERRDRLDATWKALGGQDPRYIQDTLQAAGFDVYIHEWWTPGTEPVTGVKSCAIPRNPNNYLVEGGQAYIVACGEDVAQCGEPLAQCGERLDYSTGYPLVNKVSFTELQLIPLCGEIEAAAGEPRAQCGDFDEVFFKQKEYIIPGPEDSDKWPYFVYFGAETFPDKATIPVTRKEEFEDLLLKICPLQLWIGVLVDFVGSEFEFINNDPFEFLDNEIFNFVEE
tara:strand:+ start:3483 stop:4376 length:894 start_codon:yes stop_codon:yes gene_type:complete